MELARIEEKISKKKAVELFESDELKKYRAGTFEMLAFIHRYLFSEIYDFAGKMREVNLAKGNFRFAPVMYLKAAVKNDVNSREVFMKGIDHSYYYEGYIVYKAEEL